MTPKIKAGNLFFKAFTWNEKRLSKWDIWVNGSELLCNL